MASDLQIQGEVVVNSEQAEGAFNRVGDKAQQMANEVATSATKAGQAVDKIGDGAGASAEKFTRAESRISASIKRATTELELLGKTASQRLEFNIADKGLDPKKFEPMLQRLREVEAQAQQAQRAATGSLDKMGISAAQTAAALRGVPAQFTDIITSLQGGQQPLTVFLQQGGQLKDMFGGAGAAARALGGYVLGLISPLTVAAAAGVALALAYKQGSAEADAYNKALITTGNAAGTNASQLKAYALEISGVVGTQGKAAESLAALASTGKIGAELLKEAAQAAVQYERATGQALDKTADQFASLRSEPLAAVLKLNDGMNFLTDSTYKQIKSLEEQGKTAEAANVAQRAFADTLAGRAGEMERNLGTVERGWLAVKDAAKSAWDSILNVGRASTNSDQLAAVRKQIADRENQLANGGFGENGGGAATGRPSKAATERLQAELSALQAQAAALEGIANQTRVAAEEERQRGEAVKATAAFDKAGEKFLTDKVKMERELAAARVLGAEAGKSQAEIEQRLAQIRESYSKKGGAAPKGGDPFAADREAAKQWSSYVEKFTKAAAEATAKTEGLTKSQAELVEYLQSPAYTNASEPMRETALQAAYAAIAQEQLNDATKQAAKVAADAAKSHAQFVMELSKGANAAEQQAEQLRLEEEAAALAETGYYSLAQAIELVTIKRLEEQQKGMIGNEDAYLAVQKEIDARKKLVALIGSKEARKASEDAAKSAASEWQRAADDINRSLTDALLRGFESGKDFAKNLRDTIANMFKTLVLRPIISAVINPISGAITGALGLAGTANAAASGASTLGGIGNLASLGSNLFSSGLGSTISGAIGSGVGALFGTTAGNAALGTSLGLGAGSATAAAAAAAQAGGASAAAAASAASTGATIATAIPYIGAAAAALSLLAGKFSGETRIGGQFGVAFDGSVTNQRRGQTYVIEGQQFDRDFTNGMKTALKDGIAYRLEGDPVAQEQAIRNAVSGTAASINSLLKSLGSAAVLTGFSAGLETSSKGRGGVFAGGTLSGGLQFGESGKGDNYDGTLYEKFSTNSPDFKTALENFTLDLKQSTVQALQTVSDIPKTVQMMLAGVDAESLTEEAANQLLEAINSQVVGVNTLRAAISPMGGIFSSIAAASFDAQSRLISLSGGVDQFLQNAGQFVSQYYSETEQAGVAAVQLATVLEGVGIDLTALGVDTKGEFRALVESLDVNTDAGQEQIAALLQVAPQFAELADFLQKNNMTLEQLADSAPQVSALEKLLSPQEQTAAATAESAELLGNLVGETSRVSSAISGLAASIESSTVNIVVQNQASSNVTVPRFAAGGAHQGGMRLVGENGPEFEFTGPSAIYSTSNSTDMLAAAVERGFIAGAAKSTLSVKSMAPMAAGPKTAEDIFLTKFKDWYPEFADRLNKDTIKQLMGFDFLQFSAYQSSVTPELLDTVLKLLESGFSSGKVNQYIDLIRGPNTDSPIMNPNLYLDQFKARTEWGWTPEQIKAEIQSGSTTALDSTLKSLYYGIFSKKELDQVRLVVGDAGNSMGITQDNLAKLSEAGLLQDYITKDAQGKYSLRASELFSQGGGADGAADAEQQRMNDLLAERRQLEIRLLQAQGKQQEATNLIREDAIKGLSAEAIAIYDSNRALEEQIRVQESLNGFAKEAKQLQAQLLQLGGNAAGAKEILRALAIEGLSEVEVAAYDANEALRAQIEALNGAKSAAQAALAAVEESVRAEQDRLREKFQAESAALRESIQGISDVIRTVDSALQSIRGTVADTGIAAQTAARLTLQSTLTAVRGGADIKGFESVIEQASATLTRNDPNMYATREQYVRAQDQAAGLLQGLSDVGGAQLSAAEQQLRALEKGFNEQIKRLDQVVETARKQLESTLGIEKTVLSVDAAVKQLDATMAALASAIASAAASNNNNATPIIVDEGPNGNLPWGWGGSDGTAPDVVSSQDQAAIDAYNAWIQTPGAREYQEWVQSLGSELPRYASGGMYAGGLALVGEQGPEIINFRSPGMVYNAGQTSSILGNQELLEEMRAMRKEFIELRVQAQRTADATNGNPESPMLVEVA